MQDLRVLFFGRGMTRDCVQAEDRSPVDHSSLHIFHFLFVYLSLEILLELVNSWWLSIRDAFSFKNRRTIFLIRWTNASYSPKTNLFQKSAGNYTILHICNVAALSVSILIAILVLNNCCSCCLTFCEILDSLECCYIVVASQLSNEEH